MVPSELNGEFLHNIGKGNWSVGPYDEYIIYELEPG